MLGQDNADCVLDGVDWIDQCDALTSASDRHVRISGSSWDTGLRAYRTAFLLRAATGGIAKGRADGAADRRHEQSGVSTKQFECTLRRDGV